MNFSTKTKIEILKKNYNNCCKISLLSAIIRTSGSVLSHNSNFGFDLTGDDGVIKLIAKLIKSIYGEEPKIEAIEGGKNRSNCQMISPISHKLMLDCGIIKENQGGVSLNFSLDEVLLKNNCCKQAFVCGTFIGSGSVTVPKVDSQNATSYHLEITFVDEDLKNVIVAIFAEFGFMPKVITRKDNFVLYFNNAEMVKDIITLLGATNSSLELCDIIVYKELKNSINRSQNCEMSNMNKAIDALLADRKAIMNIDQIMGLENLSESLQIVAYARLELQDMPLSQLAESLGITKSCLTHRLRKIREIAKNLSE